MKPIKIFVLLLLVTLLNACGEDPFCNCLESTGSNVSENRSVDSFTGIEVFDNVDVNLHNHPTHYVQVTCGSNLLDGISTKVENGLLKIRNNNRCNWMRNPGNNFVVDIYSPEVKDIICRTVGDIISRDTIRTYKLSVESWDGYGTINLKLNCNQALLKIHTGPVDIIANGVCESLYQYNGGNGYIRALGLQANKAWITSRSTGDCFVNTNELLDARIEYQGDVYYKGQPITIQQAISGSGKLIAY
jgi:hypothetical protein